jgi:hypothetical protein
MNRGKIVTHYDNLKVARNAPTEVIRAAYRVLAQQFHPDRFPDRALAERRMKIINEAYAVLADPDRRREHDAWIAEQELRQKTPEILAVAEDVRWPSPPSGEASGAATHPDAKRTRRGNGTFHAGRQARGAPRKGRALARAEIAIGLAVLGGMLWFAFGSIGEVPPTPVPLPASAGKDMPLPLNAARPAGKAAAPAGATFAHASRCFWIYTPIAQIGHDFPHPELLRFGQERLKWYDAYFERNKGDPGLRRAMENSVERYEPGGQKLYDLLREALSTRDPKIFSAAIDAAVTCDKILGIRTGFVPTL